MVEVYEQLEKTTKRLEKTDIISHLIKKTNADDIDVIILLLQGVVFPKWDEIKIGVASKLVLKAMNIATGIEAHKLEQEWKKKGDLGLVAEEYVGRKKQATLVSHDLTVKKVFENLRKLPEVTGHGSTEVKLKLVAELLSSATPIEAKYIVRTVLEDMRVGVGEGSIRDAIVWACFGDKLKIKYDIDANDLDMDEKEREEYNSFVKIIEEANELKNDYGEVAKIAKKEGVVGLKKILLHPGMPIKSMLYQKAEDIPNAFEMVGKPAALEYKYDGFRLQLHRDGDKINLFTRRLENVTEQFPDVVEVIKQHVKSKQYILDSEVIGIDPKTHAWLAFQQISQRIKRKYDIHQLVKDVPIMINVFDAMLVDGKNLIKHSFKERRAAIERVVQEVNNKLQPAKQLVTDDAAKAEKFYKEALAKGNEGIMMKNLEAPYKPGSRVGYGVKVKPVMETLDLVIVGADWGEGKRANWLSSFIIACRQGKEFLEIGRVGTGFKEKDEEGLSFGQLTKMLKPLTISEKGREIKVKPKIVIEINYEEIQKSPSYNSGYALRFPRVVKLRDDKPVSEISTLKQVERYYFEQRHRERK